MKKGWEIKTLGEVCDVINGLWTGKTPPYINVGVIRNTNFTKDCKLNDDDIAYLDVEIKQYQKRKLQYGDLIIEKSGGGPKQPVGRAIIFNKQEGEFSFSNFTSALRINKEIVDFRFVHKVLLYKYLNGETEKMQSHTIGIRNLDFKLYKEISIPIPPIQEQEEIVEKLDKGFELIDSLKETAKKNLDNAKELFQSVLREELSPKEGWETKKLGEVCDFYNGKAHENCVDENGKYHLINSKFVSSNGLISKKTNSQLFPLFKDDIVFVMSDVPKGKTLAKCYFVEEDNKYTLNQRICVFRNSKINVDYLCKYINRNNYFLEFDNGENQTNLRKEDILKCPIYIPSIKEQEEIVERLDRIKGYCEELEGNYKRVLELCEELKQGLLREAFEVR